VGRPPAALPLPPTLPTGYWVQGPGPPTHPSSRGVRVGIPHS
jgi:hypothetical protein